MCHIFYSTFINVITISIVFFSLDHQTAEINGLEKLFHGKQNSKSLYWDTTE